VGSTGQSKEGYLAIATSTAPSFPLDVAGTIQSTGFKLLTGAGANKILTSDASGVASWQVPAGGSLWSQSGDDIYYNTGNVAIGTSTPGTAKLKILGGVLDMTSQKITSLAIPTNDADAATKAYVDAASGGVCYEVYGSNTCFAGWERVVNGYSTIYFCAEGSNKQPVALVCSPITHSASGSYYCSFSASSRMYYGTMIESEVCAICCK